MPAKSQSQRGLVFSKRDQYGVNKTFVSESVDDFIDPDEDYMDFNGEAEEEMITTFGPHDTPVSEEPIEFKPSRIKDLERKHRPQRSKKRWFSKFSK